MQCCNEACLDGIQTHTLSQTRLQQDPSPKPGDHVAAVIDDMETCKAVQNGLRAWGLIPGGE